MSTNDPAAEPRLAVTLVFPAAAWGGAEIWQERLSDATNRLDTRVVTLEDGRTADRWRERGVPVTVIPTGRRPADLITSAWRLGGRLRRDRPDLIVAHGVKAGLVAAAAGLLTSTRTVWVRHDDSFPRAARLLDQLTDGQIRTSGRLWGDRRPRNPLELQPVAGGEPLDRAAALAALDLDAAPEVRRVAMANRLARYKGVDDAIQALADPAAEGWQLDVYGIDDPAYPDELRRLQRLAADWRVAERVSFRQPRPDIGRLLAAYDAVAVLTKPLPGENVSSESFSMTAMEAQLAGVAVISVPPVCDRIAAGGIAVAPAAPAEVAAALGRIAAGFQVGGAGGVRRSAADAAAEFTRFLAGLAHRPGIGLVGDEPITVVTTALNDADALPGLIERILPQLGPEDEWCFVDGGSKDGTVELIQSVAEVDPRITVLVEPGAGISAGRNVGIAAARNELIACTDVGCEPDDRWLAAFRAAAADWPDAGLLTGTYRATSNSAWQRAMDACGYPQVSELAHPSVLARVYGRLLGRVFDATMPTGRSMAFPRASWKEVGGFPEHLATGEDVLFGRAIAAQSPAVRVGTSGSSSGPVPPGRRSAAFSSVDIRPGIPPSSALRSIHPDDTGPPMNSPRCLLVRDAEVAWHQRPTLRSTLKMYREYGRGSGRSRNLRLLGRDLARAGAYPAGLALVLWGPPAARAAAAAGMGVVLSLPLARAARMAQPVQTVALTPVMAAMRDLAKAYGAILGLAEGER